MHHKFEPLIRISKTKLYFIRRRDRDRKDDDFNGSELERMRKQRAEDDEEEEIDRSNSKNLYPLIFLFSIFVKKMRMLFLYEVLS